MYLGPFIFFSCVIYEQYDLNNHFKLLRYFLEPTVLWSCFLLAWSAMMKLFLYFLVFFSSWLLEAFSAVLEVFSVFLGFTCIDMILYALICSARSCSIVVLHALLYFSSSSFPASLEVCSNQYFLFRSKSQWVLLP